MLHLVNSASMDDALLGRVAAGDALVMLDDAVLRCLRAGKVADILAGILHTSRCYVLSEHLVLRGIQASELIAGIEIIDYPALVNLTVEHAKLYTWV